MTTDLIVYGASDDLIEVEGLVREEFCPPYDGPVVVTVMVDDASYAAVHVEYDPDKSGEWRLRPVTSPALVRVVPAIGEDNDEGDAEDGCPAYSDKAVVNMQGLEARRVNVRIAQSHDRPSDPEEHRPG